MKRIQNVFIIAFALMAVFTFTAKPAWADRFTMADIALIECRNGVREEPSESGIVKYREWYSENSQGEYDRSGKWDAVFACWCADQMGYITRNCFPMTDSTEELLNWFIESGYQMYSINDFLSSGGTVIRPGDVIFIPSEDEAPELKVGIMTSADTNEVSYVMGDVEGAVRQCWMMLSHSTENIVFFPVIPSESDNYLEIVRFLSEKMSLNPAAVCGIVANIIYESNGIPTALGDNGT